VLWLTVVVALAVGWWLDHRRLSDRRWVTISSGFVSAKLLIGEKLELEHLPNGKIGERIIPAGGSR